jgi:hypothetical protein
MVGRGVEKFADLKTSLGYNKLGLIKFRMADKKVKKVAI